LFYRCARNIRINILVSKSVNHGASKNVISYLERSLLRSELFGFPLCGVIAVHCYHP
jgi:hypothetical protein